METDRINVGLDIGTTSCVVGVYDLQSQPVQHPDGSMLPSVVWFADRKSRAVDGTVRVGSSARQAWEQGELYCFRSAKLHLQATDDQQNSGGWRFYPSWTSAEGCLAELISHCLLVVLQERVLQPNLKTVQLNIVLTRPACWSGQSLQRLQHAWNDARELVRRRWQGKAKLNLALRFVEEPVAAMLHWFTLQPQEWLSGRSLLVCDAGGGTLDLSLVTAADGKRAVVHGQHRLLRDGRVDTGGACGDFVDGLIGSALLQQSGGVTVAADDLLTLASDGSEGGRFSLDVRLRLQSIGLDLSPLQARHVLRDARNLKESWTEENPRCRAVSGAVQPFMQQIKQQTNEFLRRVPTANGIVFAGGMGRFQPLRKAISEAVQQHSGMLPTELDFDELELAISLGAAVLAAERLTVDYRWNIVSVRVRLQGAGIDSLSQLDSPKYEGRDLRLLLDLKAIPDQGPLRIEVEVTSSSAGVRSCTRMHYQFQPTTQQAFDLLLRPQPDDSQAGWVLRPCLAGSRQETELWPEQISV
jgi:hypothetical protein